jgi:hypothetical protein
VSFYLHLQEDYFGQDDPLVIDSCGEHTSDGGWLTGDAVVWFLYNHLVLLVWCALIGDYRGIYL